MEQFISKYEEPKFWGKLKRYAKSAGYIIIEKVLTLYYTLQDGDTPKKEKTVILGALGYFILPLDLIPDFVPVTGFSDDLTAIAAAIYVVSQHIKPSHKELAGQKLQKIFGG
jgi:uncharacterized membrane protein YkvA (DUF1232 family)